MNTEKILTYVGLAAASRSAVIGIDRIMKCIRRGGTVCVLLAGGASERTVKQVSDKCAYYSVPLVRLDDADMYDLGQRCGKKAPAAAVCITNASLAKEIVKYADE